MNETNEPTDSRSNVFIIIRLAAIGATSGLISGGYLSYHYYDTIQQNPDLAALMPMLLVGVFVGALAGPFVGSRFRNSFTKSIIATLSGIIFPVSFWLLPLVLSR